jgi:hypothetical protein
MFDALDRIISLYAATVGAVYLTMKVIEAYERRKDNNQKDEHIETTRTGKER